MLLPHRIPRFAALALAVLTLASGCDKPSTSPLDLGSGTASDESGTVNVEMTLLDRPGNESELSFRLVAVGTEEMDKLALDVAVDEMFVVDGVAQWSGFVPPRQPQSHRVVVKPVDGASAPRVRVKVSRFRDSQVLMLREVNFSPDGTHIPE
ncbi:MAG: hypothetical protein ACRBN8_38785 [Nannocystales bacterium]